MPIGNWEHIVNLGMSGVIFAGFLCVLSWVFKINNELLRDMAEERKQHLTNQAHFAERMKELSTGTRDFQQQVAETHKYQRDEHEKMLTLIREMTRA